MAKPARESLPQLHRPSPVQPNARSQQRQAADGTVSSSVLARHLDLRYQGVLQLADERVIERLPSGRLNLDHARLHYIRRLRDPERRAQKSQVDQDFIRAKIELIVIRVREKQVSLMETETAIANMEK